MPLRAIVRLYRQSVADLPAPVWMLAGAALVNRSGTMVLPFLALYFTEQRGLSVTAAGRLVAVFGLGSIVGSTTGGWLSDRIGAFRTQQLSLVVGGALFVVLPLVPSVTWKLAVAVLLMSVASEAFRPAVMSAMARTVGRALQARAFALLRLAVNAGMTLGPAIGGVIALHDYDWLFYCDAGTCWLAAALLQRWRRRLADSAVPGPEPSGAPAPAPWSDGPFVAFLLLVVLLATGFFQVFSTVPLYLRDAYGLRENVIGALLALNALMIVAFELVLVRSVERLRRLPLIGLGGLLICAGLALLPLGRSLWVAVASVIVWTVGEMLALPLMSALVAERAGVRQTGRYMGLYGSAFSMAFVLGPLIGAGVYERIGPAALWLGIGACGPLIAIAALALSPAFEGARPR